MSKTARNILAIGIAVALMAIAVIYSILSSRLGIIDENVVGNTAGNLNNSGLFCESDGVVYFANPYDSYALYSMNPDGTDLKCLNDLSVKFINAGGDYVFFYGKTAKTTSGLGGLVSKPAMYEITKNGKKLRALTKDVSQNMLLVGNKVYYQHYRVKEGTTFAVIDRRTKQSTELLDFMINPACYDNGNFYYNGMYKDHFLYAYNVASGENVVIWEGDIWNPIYSGGYVYYMDVQGNYRICRYSIADNTIEILTKDRVDYFNLYDNIIYYQKSSSSDACLKRMNCDGSGNEVIAQGVYSSVNITSQYAYFIPFDNENMLYCTPTYGYADVKEFVPAMEAAIKHNTGK